MENILSGNPLINLAGQQQQQTNQSQNTFRVKRRYLTKTHVYAQHECCIWMQKVLFTFFYFFKSTVYLLLCL